MSLYLNRANVVLAFKKQAMNRETFIQNWVVTYTATVRAIKQDGKVTVGMKDLVTFAYLQAELAWKEFSELNK